MSAPAAIVCICILAVAYNYVGYPLLLFLLSMVVHAKADLLYLTHRRDRRSRPRSSHLPHVAVLVAVHNEEAVIHDKVRNCLELDYAHDRVEFWLGLDAPTDSTASILKQARNDRLHIVEFAKRRGKLAVLLDLAQHTSAEILVFTDANTMLDRNCVRTMVRHFIDPSVGAVTGEEIRTVAKGSDPGPEAIYWRYESAIKVLESRLNCSLGGNGAALALRRSLFKPQDGLIADDFQIPFEIRFQGHRVVYDPEAIAIEEITPARSAQFARRVRVSAASYQVLFRNYQYLNPLRGLLTFSFVSHKVLRWLAPFFLLIAFFSSVAMAVRGQFFFLVEAQCAFYIAALVGYALKRRGKSVGLLSLPLYFCSMNLALLLGFHKYVTGRQGVTWIATPRRSEQPESMLDQAAFTVEVRTTAHRPAA